MVDTEPVNRTARWRRAEVRSVGIPALDPTEEVEVAFGLQAAQRGVLLSASLRVWCSDPLGLFAQLVTSSNSLVVTALGRPAPFSHVPPLDLSARSWPHHDEAIEINSSLGHGIDFVGLLPYVCGDLLRRLHWPALARTGALVVREFNNSQDTPAFTVVIDDRPSPTKLGFEDRDARFEKLVALAARACLDATALGSTVLLGTVSGSAVRIEPGPGAVDAILAALATVPTPCTTSNCVAYEGRSFGSSPLDQCSLGANGGPGAPTLVVTEAPESLPGRYRQAMVVVP